jgi:ribosome maturation factor RimP
MIEKKDIADIVEEFISTDPDYYLVDVRVSSTSRVTVLFDRKSGGIRIEDCARLSRFLENRLDREKEDFELQVSSPGLEMPFLAQEQYIKNQGRKVEVTDIEGNKFKGIMKNVNHGGFELETEVKLKGKVQEIKDLSFNFSEIKTVKIIIEFK